MKLKKLGAFAATGAMALALALTGCGSSNATSGSDAGSSSSTTLRSRRSTAQGVRARQGRHADRRHLCRVRPFEYKDDNGDYQGFDLELIKAIGDKLGLDVEYVNNDFDTLVPGCFGRQVRRLHRGYHRHARA
ncbi:MAG: transporter substrate-binding domain-containing protein [Collinsella sp.]